MTQWHRANNSISMPSSVDYDAGRLVALLANEGDAQSIVGVYPSTLPSILARVPQRFCDFRLSAHRLTPADLEIGEPELDETFSEAVQGRLQNEDNNARVYIYGSSVNDAPPDPYMMSHNRADVVILRTMERADRSDACCVVTPMDNQVHGPSRIMHANRRLDKSLVLAGPRIAFGVRPVEHAVAEDWTEDDRTLYRRTRLPGVRLDLSTLGSDLDRLSATFRAFHLSSENADAVTFYAGAEVLARMKAAGKDRPDGRFFFDFDGASPFDIIGVQYWGPGYAYLRQGDKNNPTDTLLNPANIDSGWALHDSLIEQFCTVGRLITPPGNRLRPVWPDGRSPGPLNPLLRDVQPTGGELLSLRELELELLARSLEPDEAVHFSDRPLGPHELLAFKAFDAHRDRLDDDARRNLQRALRRLGFNDAGIGAFVEAPQIFFTLLALPDLAERVAGSGAMPTTAASNEELLTARIAQALNVDPAGLADPATQWRFMLNGAAPPAASTA